MIPRAARFPARPPQSLLLLQSIVSRVWAEEKSLRGARISSRCPAAQPERRTKDAANFRDPAALPGASRRRRAGGHERHPAELQEDGQARAQAGLTAAPQARAPLQLQKKKIKNKK